MTFQPYRPVTIQLLPYGGGPFGPALLKRRKPLAGQFPVKMLLRADGGADHAGGVPQHGGDDGAGAVGDAQGVAVQHVFRVLQQAVAHVGHTAPDDDDLRVIQAEDRAEAVAQQLAGLLHRLRGHGVALVIGAGEEVRGNRVQIVLHPFADDAVAALLHLFPERAQDP